MVTASIVTYKTDAEELRSCLSCLSSNLISRIYVVDNSCSAYIEEICSGYDKVEYIPSRNIGYGAAHNIAICRALDWKAPYHLVLNSDTSFSSDIFSGIIEYMDRNVECGALQPRILNADGSDQFTVRLLPTPLDMASRLLLPYRLRRHRTDRYELRHINRNDVFNPPYHQGSFMFIRTDALRKVGLFDQRFFMYPEDIDLTRRIHALYTTVYYPGATVVHHHRAQSHSNIKICMIHIINMIRYFNKWGWFNDPQRKEFNKNFQRSIATLKTYI